VDEVLLAFDVDARGRHLQWARRAVRQAGRDFAGKWNWTYYLRHQTVQTLAPFSDGTIAMTTGGVVTLTGATWPADMLYRRLLISDQVYFVTSITSSTVLTVSGPPITAIASGSSYQALLAEYPLPQNTRRITELVPTSGVTACVYTPPDQALQYRSWQNTAGNPSSYTIRGDQKRAGRQVIEFSPMPTSARRYEFMTYASPGDAEPKMYPGGSYQYNVGNATWSDGGTTITGAGTAWTESMVGSIIRFSSIKSPPDGEFGKNPAVAARVVTAVGSGTSLTVDEAMEGAGSQLGYSISDPLDVPPEMWNFFVRMAEYEFAKGTKGGPELQFRRDNYLMALEGAMVADQAMRPPQWGSWAWIPITQVLPV